MPTPSPPPPPPPLNTYNITQTDINPLSHINPIIYASLWFKITRTNTMIIPKVAVLKSHMKPTALLKLYYVLYFKDSSLLLTHLPAGVSQGILTHLPAGVSQGVLTHLPAGVSQGILTHLPAGVSQGVQCMYLMHTTQQSRLQTLNKCCFLYASGVVSSSAGCCISRYFLQGHSSCKKVDLQLCAVLYLQIFPARTRFL